MSTPTLTTRYSKYYRRRSTGRVLLVGLICLGLVGLMAKLVSVNPVSGITLAAIALIVVAVCRWPLFGYLMAMAIVFPCEFFANPDGISPYTILPLTNLNIYTSVPISATPLELILALTALVTFIRTSIKGKVFLDRGLTAKGMALLVAFLFFGYIWGVYVKHGDSKSAQTEIRALFYIPVLYFLTVHFMRERNLWKIFNWILPVGLSLLCALIVWRFFVLVDAPGQTFYKESLNGLNHDSAILIVVLLMWCFSKLVFNGSRIEKIVATVMISPAIFCIFISGRRAAFAVLAGCIIMLLAMLCVRRRNAFIVTAIILAVIIPPYVIAFSKASGPLGTAARAFSSSSATPGSRDYNSDLYRLVEKSNVQMTIKEAPFTGIGFGQTFTQYIFFVNLDGFGFQYFTPHVQILWLWLKLGMFGWATIWFLICTSLFKLGQVVKYDKYGVQMSMCIVAGSIIGGIMIYAYLDLSFVNTRLMTILGAAIGMLEVGYLATMKSRQPAPPKLVTGSANPGKKLVAMK